MFKVGYCINCDARTQVTDFAGRPIKGLPGTKLVWICLCDDDDKVITHVGTVSLCKDCDPDKADPNHALDKLFANDKSGVTEQSLFELRDAKKLRFKLEKRFGE